MQNTIRLQSSNVRFPKDEIQSLIDYNDSKGTTKRITDYLVSQLNENGYTVTLEYEKEFYVKKYDEKVCINGRVDILAEKDGKRIYIEIDRSMKEWSVQKLDYILQKEPNRTCIWFRWKTNINTWILRQYDINIQVLDIIDYDKRNSFYNNDNTDDTKSTNTYERKYNQKFVRIPLKDKSQFDLEKLRKDKWYEISSMTDTEKRRDIRRHLIQVKRCIEHNKLEERTKMLNDVNDMVVN